MKKLLVAFFITLFASEAFAEVPIVFSRCKATDEWTDARTVNVGGVPVEVTKTFKGMSNLDRVNEVTYPLSLFWTFDTVYVTPCDLIYRDGSGNETVIENCTSVYNAGGGVAGTATCNAMDASVSYDGTEILYTVVHGTVYNRLVRWPDYIYRSDADPGDDGWKPLPNDSNSSTGAQIKRHVIGGSTTEVTPSTNGVWDLSPFYLPNGRVGFVSTRTGSSLTYKTTNVIQHTTASDPVMAIWTADIDGKNLEEASSHARNQEQHPIVLKDGRVAYSSWQTGMGIPFSKTQGTAGRSFTIVNSFKIWAQYPDGSRNFPLIGQHSPQAAVNSSGEDFNALHFFAQLPNTDICFGNYYRGNNLGLGAIGCYPLPGNFGEEGEDPLTVILESDQYLPKNGYNVATWAINSDDISTTMYGFPTTPVTHPNYTSGLPFSGKLGWPFAIPAGDGAIGVTWGKGSCGNSGNDDAIFQALGKIPGVDYHAEYEANNNGDDIAVNYNTKLTEFLQEYGNGYTSDIPGCDMGIYKAASIPITNPDDLTMIVDTKGYHEFGARAVVPYTNIYGVSAPTNLSPIKSSDLTKGSPFGFVGAASVTDRETEPRGGVPDLTTVNIHAFNLQGTETVEGLTDDDFCGVRFFQMHHNDGANIQSQVYGSTGERLAILGDIYVKNKDGLGDPIKETDGIHNDTSFLVSIPANIPYTMAAIDCSGRNLAIDQTWQHVKPGEIKTCGGCHVGHSPDHPPRNNFSASYAADPAYTPYELGKGVVPILSGEDGSGDPVYVNHNGYGLIVNYDEHIKPILLNRCASCHSNSGDSTGNREKGLILDYNPNQDLYKENYIKSTYWRLVYDNFQDGLSDIDPVTSTQYWLTEKHNYGGTTNLNRPYLSKYIVAFNSRRSLLYWKAAGQRTDNNTDGEYSGDLDYGDTHPSTGITSNELLLLSNWIDSGAQAGPGIATDKSPPTIHMNVTLNGSNEITDIIVGTVDLGSGINPGTLNVCLVSGGSCGSNLAGPANMHGITSISLGTPISDTNQAIRATVSDVSGNSRTIEYTAGHLIALGDTTSPPTPDPVQINVGGNETITKGDTFSRTITFSDGEDTNNDGWTYDIDWCGTPENGNSVSAGQSSFNISRLFSTSGSCAVTITITDDTGETDQGSFTITIDDVSAPGLLTINAGGNVVLKEGTTFSRRVTLTDGGDSGNDGWTYSVDWGSLGTTNGTIPAGSTQFEISKLIPDGNDTITVTVTVTDVDPDIATDTFIITSMNVPPSGQILGSSTATVGVEYSIVLQISDPGTDTIISRNINWGDGTMNDRLTHTYTEAGVYKIDVVVDDEDGLWRIGRKRIVVQ